MINRLARLGDQPEDRPPAENYWEIDAQSESFYVSSETATAVLRLLERRWPPRWIRFTTLFGAAVRVRSARIQHVVECTKEQRAAVRAFFRARREERKADGRPWEDEEWW